MTLDLDRLEALARAATPGPWKPTDGYEASQAGRHDDDVSVLEDASGDPVIEHVYYDGHHTIVRPRDVQFIAAANPAVILDLVERLRAAERPRIASCTVCGCDEVAQTRDVAELQERLRRAEEAIAVWDADYVTGSVSPADAKSRCYEAMVDAMDRYHATAAARGR